MPHTTLWGIFLWYNASMIVTLYGPDSYRLNRKLNQLLDSYRSKHVQTDICDIDISEHPDAWQEVRDFLKQPALFVDAKVAVVREVASVTEKEWIRTLKSVVKSNSRIVVLATNHKKPSRAFSFLYTDPAKSQEFAELSGASLQQFIARELEELRVKLSPEALRFFMSYLEAHNDRSWRIVQVVAITGLAGFTQPVSLRDMQSIVHWDVSEELFTAVRRLLNTQNLSERLAVLEKLYIHGESLAHVFNLLAYQAHGKNAARIAAYDVLKKSGKLEDSEALLAFTIGALR